MSNWVISIKLTYIKENLENIETVKYLKGSAYIMDNRMKNISENVLWPWPIIFNLAYNYLLWPSHWLGSKFLHTINHKTLIMWSTCMTLIGLSEVYVSPFQKNVWSDMTLTYKHHAILLHTFNKRHTVGNVWTRLDQQERRYVPEKDCSLNSAMTFTFLWKTSVSKRTSRIFYLLTWSLYRP